uniref:natural cytotoxicity triggering receptor 3-like n=1 Tax=Podarcis muralis TaxID=64176 RepID=UPI00109FCB7B|nr:natural cytotoxicity triggering receptor 3-like [Podarcis muralis]
MMPLEVFCFILWAASQAQEPLMVSQPSSAEGAEGGSVTLTCSYNSTSEPKVGSFRWVKEPGVEVRKTTREFMGRVSPTSEQAFLLERRADIEIRDLRHYDSGVYRCVVKIPGFQETSGNGTELRVLKAAKGKELGFCGRNDKKAESTADLNYSEVVVKKVGKSKRQSEKVTYASIRV